MKSARLLPRMFQGPPQRDRLSAVRLWFLIGGFVLLWVLFALFVGEEPGIWLVIPLTIAGFAAVTAELLPARAEQAAPWLRAAGQVLLWASLLLMFLTIGR